MCLLRGRPRIVGGGEGGGTGGKKAPPPLNLSHISYTDEIWHTYILPKKDPKNL